MVSVPSGAVMTRLAVNGVLKLIVALLYITGIGVMSTPRHLACVCTASSIAKFTVSLTVMVTVSCLLYEVQPLLLVAVIT